jgi:sugar O-acyltransferase (sialic acid O-acetyltransferase NeuD family)
MGDLRPIVIAGAGNLAALLLDCLDGDDRWRPVACLDDGKAGSTIMGVPVLDPCDHDPRDCRQAFIAIGEPPMRRQFVKRLEALELDWLSFVDRRSHVSRHARLGAGSLVFPFATIAPASSVGRFCYLGAYASVGGKAVVEDYCSLLPRASVGSCVIGEGCSLGLNSTCLDGAVLGERVTVAPHTLLRRDVPDGALVAGNPARVVTR